MSWPNGSPAASKATARSRSCASRASRTPARAISPSSPTRSTWRRSSTTRASAGAPCATTRRARVGRTCGAATRGSVSRRLRAPSDCSRRDGGRRPACTRWRRSRATRRSAQTCRSARSSRSAKARSIGDRTVVFPNVTIGPGARIGADCVIHSNVAIRERVTIGDRVVLQNGVVVGGDGYGFVRRGDGTHEKIPQVATVVIEDDVELGANTTVDRPAVGETRIKAGTKIDNLVQIAHGVIVGRNVLMAAQVGIAGSTEIGDDVMFGGQVGVGGHLTIGRGAVAVGQSGVTNSVEPGAMVAGYPAIDAREWRRAVGRLPPPSRAEATHRGARGAARRAHDARRRRLRVIRRVCSARSRMIAGALSPLAAQARDPVLSALRLPSQRRAPVERRSAVRLGHELRRRARFRRLRHRPHHVRRQLRGDPRRASSVASIPTRATTSSTWSTSRAHAWHTRLPRCCITSRDILAIGSSVEPVDWNMFGVAVERDVRRGALRIRPHGDLLGVLLKSSVDYRWEANARRRSA